MTHEELIAKTEEIACQIGKAKNAGKPIAYLSGKVTGLKPEAVSQKFRRDANRLKTANWWVFNPTEWIENECDWRMAMRLCLAVLPLCEMVFKQADWKDSEGAIMESETAVRLGINTHDL